MECCCNPRRLTFPRSRHGALPFPKGRRSSDTTGRSPASVGVDFHVWRGLLQAIYRDFHTGAYREQRNPIVYSQLRCFSTPLMRERYPRYAFEIGLNTLLMREFIPRICVEICQLPQEDQEIVACSYLCSHRFDDDPAKLGYVVTSSIFSEAAALIPIVSPLPSQGFLARTGRSSSFWHHLNRGLRDTHYLS